MLAELTSLLTGFECDKNGNCTLIINGVYVRTLGMIMWESADIANHSSSPSQHPVHTPACQHCGVQWLVVLCASVQAEGCYKPVEE